MTKTPSLLLAALVAVLFADHLAAQKMPVPRSGKRLLQLFDLRDVQDPRMRAEAGYAAESARGAADLLRHLITPPLRPGDDVTVLGKHWLALFADGQRIASAERVFAAAKAHREDLVTIEIHLLDVDADQFEKQLERDLQATKDGDERKSFESVIEPAKAEAFLKRARGVADEAIAAPTIATRPLQAAQLSIVKQTAFVREFVIQHHDGKRIADPVVDTVWDGHRSNVCATLLPAGRIGLSCDVELQEVEKPIRTYETKPTDDLPALTVQLPHTTGVRLRSVAEIAPGSLVVVAAPRASGDYLVAIVSATVSKPR